MRNPLDPATFVVLLWTTACNPALLKMFRDVNKSSNNDKENNSRIILLLLLLLISSVLSEEA